MVSIVDAQKNVIYGIDEKEQPYLGAGYTWENCAEILMRHLSSHQSKRKFSFWWIVVAFILAPIGILLAGFDATLHLLEVDYNCTWNHR